MTFVIIATTGSCDPLSDTNDDFEQRLAKDKLVTLVGCTPVVVFMCQCDHILYQCIVDVLIPEVLRHIPGDHYFLCCEINLCHDNYNVMLLRL